MKEPEAEVQGTRAKANEVLFVLFKHRRKILLCAAVGIIAAIVYLRVPHRYESNAKLMVRYVIDRSAIDKVDPQAQMLSGEAVINSEVEILTSWDLAVQVARAIGVVRLAPEGTETDAAQKIRSSLSVTALKESNIILIACKQGDPDLARRILDELVNRYFEKHLEVHRSTGAFDFVAQRTEEVRQQLYNTEEELQRVKAKAGVVSIAESGAAFSAALAKSQETLKAADVELAEQRARVKDLEVSLAVTGGNATAALPVARERDDLQRYQSLAMQMARMREREVDLLSKYTPDSPFVKINQAQISALRDKRREIEGRSPGIIATTALPDFNRVPQLDIVSERARLAALEAAKATLESQESGFREQVDRLSEVETKIAELERKKELEETSYKYFESSLERARVDEALDPSKIPNISVVQKPTVAMMNTERMGKIALALAGGGIVSGLTLALFLGLVWDESVKRPLELERRFGIPLWVSIPFLTDHDRVAMDAKIVSEGSRKELQNAAGYEVSDLIQPYCDAIRDRLALCFESNSVQHKPKFIAVTSLSEGAGTSTIARGIAAALSEAGDDKVLLVAMDIGLGETDTFFEGRPTCSLVEALQREPRVPVAENLCLAAVPPSETRTGRLVPKKFYALMPDMKASDFEYIVFDMAPINQSGVTLAVAGLMDKVLLVVEAEKHSRGFVKRAYTELVAAKASVSAVFNKDRSYVPKWLDGEA